jgi:molybdopterin synthase sulfur carrier subunit
MSSGGTDAGVRVRIPTPLRSYTGGAAQVTAAGTTVGEVLDDLDRQFPGLAFRVIDEQRRMRQHMLVWLHGERCRDLDASVSGVDEVVLMQALSGGDGPLEPHPVGGPGGGRRADDIPVASTPPGGWTAMPPPVLAGCTEPLVAGAPDLRGTWRVVEVAVDGVAVDPHPALGREQRIEQCGDRLVVTASGIVHDMRCDGSVERGVHDVAEIDKRTPITVVASYEDGVHVLRPVGLPVEVTRRRDGDQMIWGYVGFVARLDRVDVDPIGHDATAS